MQEEELSVSEVLSSIRDVLSKEMNGEILELANDHRVNKQELSDSYKIEPIRPPVFHKSDNVFELTPQMRVNQSSFLPASSFSDKHEQNSHSSLAASHNIEKNLQPAMQEWLDKNMPGIVEKVVTRELNRIFSKK